MKVSNYRSRVLSSGPSGPPEPLPCGRSAARPYQHCGAAGVQPGREGDEADNVPLPGLRSDHRAALCGLRAADLRDRESQPVGGRPNVLHGVGCDDVPGEVGGFLLPAVGALSKLYHGGGVV